MSAMASLCRFRVAAAGDLPMIIRSGRQYIYDIEPDHAETWARD